MKSNEDFLEDVYRKRDDAIRKRKRRMRQITATVAVAVLAVGIGVGSSGILRDVIGGHEDNSGISPASVNGPEGENICLRGGQEPVTSQNQSVGTGREPEAGTNEVWSASTEELTGDFTGTALPALTAEAGSDLTQAERTAARDAVLDAACTLFQSCQAESGEDNLLVSPLSLLLALDMTEQGAEGNTLAEFEAMMDGQTRETLTAYLAGYQADVMGQADGEKAPLKIANSVWVRDEADALTVEPAFLDAVSENFGAQVFSAAFDAQTVEDINAWCREATDGMIDTILQEIDPSDVMHLLNAVCFDAEWAMPYDEYSVKTDVFTALSGEEQQADLMFSQESTYLENDSVRGFLKPYKGGRYSFLALLPQEGVSLDRAAASLTGPALSTLLAQARTDISVHAALPRFSFDWDAEMTEILQSMGLHDLFEADTADLSGMGQAAGGNLFVSKVLQKTHIEVDTAGTRAAAVTDVAVATQGAFVEEETVRLDRPFIFGILDTETNLPVFLGTLCDLQP